MALPIPPLAPVTRAVRLGIWNIRQLSQKNQIEFNNVCIPFGSETAIVNSSGAILRARPERTFPAPISTKVSTPFDFISKTVYRQRTKRVVCSTSNLQIVFGSRTGSAVTLAINGTEGVETFKLLSVSLIVFAAEAIKLQ